MIAFFRGYNVVANSVKFKSSNEGKSTRQAAVLFSSEADGLIALKHKQKKEIKGRWVQISELDLADYEKFESYNPQTKNVRCGAGLTLDNYK